MPSKPKRKRPVRRGICAVVYREKGRVRQYLVLHRVLHWRGWEFLKGGREKGERPRAALLRELWEETRIREFEKITPTPLELVFWDRIRGAEFHGALFLVHVPWDTKVKVGGRPVEHSSFRWVTLPVAKKMLTHRDQKELLARAAKRIAMR